MVPECSAGRMSDETVGELTDGGNGSISRVRLSGIDVSDTLVCYISSRLSMTRSGPHQLVYPCWAELPLALDEDIFADRGTQPAVETDRTLQGQLWLMYVMSN